MLEKLVGFPTISDRSNLPLIAFVEDYLREHGVSSSRIPDATGEKASLIATIGPQNAGGVVLSAHTDVVPVEGQDWTSDPFVLREDNGRLFGRGTADMKGFAATVLAHVPDMIGAELKVPIHIALSYDEEVGCFGAPPMIDRLLEDGPLPSSVIVGEPSNMRVVTGHKGVAVLKTQIKGHPVHSSQPDRGVSAISIAARLISWLEAETLHNKANATASTSFQPPYTTLHCGMIKGGSALNITAAECQFVTDIRVIPGETGSEWIGRYRQFVETDIVPAMKAVHAECGVDITVLADIPGLRSENAGQAELLARQLTGDNTTNIVVFSTEGGQFQDRGLSTVVCGPGSIKQAHEANEFIEIAELKKCSDFLHRLCSKLS